MIRLVFSNETRERLRHERIHHPHPRVRQRLEALYLKSEGWSHQAICASVGITKPTLIGYLRRYQEEGWAGLTACRFRRTRSALAPHEATIVLAFRRQPPATLAEASTRITELTGIERSPAQVGKVLQQFGLKRRKTGAIPGPAPTPERQAEQARFQQQELEPRLAQAQAGQRAVFFVDAAHFVHGLFLSWLWCVARCWQPTPTGRHRLSVLGALNAITHELITVTTEAYINSASVCQLLRQLAELALPVPITVILDNARYQRCRLVQDTAAALKIELLFLPAYSPQFNLIERFWKLVKKCCLHAHYYPTFQDFKTSILHFIETAHVEKKQTLKSLLTFNFQSFKELKVGIS